MKLLGIGFSIFWSVVFLQTSILLSAYSVIGRKDTDNLSLLALKAQVEDPLGVLNSWNESVDFCEWKGITCGQRHKRVTVLDLQSSQLKGILSPYVGNLSFLRTLNLQNNTFSHDIPPEIGRLFRLETLLFLNNSFSGRIPVNITRCYNLRILSLRGNNLTGEVPEEIGSLFKLQKLYLDMNKLVGKIPSSFGNLSSIEVLSLQGNSFHGHIPNMFGQLENLMSLSLAQNNLTGTFPASIYNLSYIKFFSVARNKLQGRLPPDFFHSLPNLETLLITGNQFTGPVPVSISNATNLLNFLISFNNFTGKVPSLARLSNLLRLVIHVNNLGYHQDDDLNFLSSLVNCTDLEILEIADNDFGGVLPNTMSNFSTKLWLMILGNSGIHGSIPTGIGNLISLESIGFEQNQLTGPIPSSIGKLHKLKWLYLNDNKLTGEIPNSLGNLTMLNRLYLTTNNLQGSIPSSLGECKSLLTMDLSQNNLSGPIPKQIMSLSSLSDRLDLSSNHLIGSIPMEVGKLVTLSYLNISENELVSEIPETLGSCTSLLYLLLEGNSLHGTIPSTLGSLRGIEEIDFSRNNLYGKIPVYLETFHFLNYLNLSFNDFEGAVPVKGVFNNTSSISIAGNTRLCGGIPQLNLSSCSTNLHKEGKRSRKLKLIISIACGLVSVILVVLLLMFYLLKKRIKSSNLESSFGISLLKVSYGDLFKATDGFSSANLIGAGSFGSVYRGILNQEERQVVAVKVINLQTSGGSKSFLAECKALKSMKHRNLVRIITACSSIDYQGNDFKALVYEFMVNGSLEKWLHPNNRENSEQEHRHLSLIERVNICIDVANALDYLHNHYHVPIVHCDLKPSNVLLDSEMNAHLGDFGLVRFLPDASHPFSSGQASSLGIRGSIGYIAPEYGMGSEVSTLGDVFSYGILLLEMFTGKSPTDVMFRDGLNLHNFGLMGMSTCVEEIVDPMLLQREEESSNSTTHNGNGAKNQQIHDCLISIIKIGVACSSELQRARMDIANVVAELCHIKDRLVGTKMQRKQ